MFNYNLTINMKWELYDLRISTISAAKKPCSLGFGLKSWLITRAGSRYLPIQSSKEHYFWLRSALFLWSRLLIAIYCKKNNICSSTCLYRTGNGVKRRLCPVFFLICNNNYPISYSKLLSLRLNSSKFFSGLGFRKT